MTGGPRLLAAVWLQRRSTRSAPTPPELVRVRHREAQKDDAEAIRLLALLAVGCSCHTEGVG